MAVLTAFAAILSASAANHTITLEWDPNPETDLAGYMVFWGETSGDYIHATNVVGTTRVTLSGFEPGVTNYFAVLAYNVHNQAGELSDEIAYAVPPEETLPAIAPIADQVTAEDQPLRVGFMLVGGQVAPDLEIWATTSDPLLISPARVSFTGTGREREAILTPVRHRSGAARIAFHVSDGRATNFTTFSLLVAPVNDPPVISNVRDLVLLPGTSRTVGFFVADAETPGPELRVTAATTNPELMPLDRILLQNDGNDRSITLSPVAGAYGTAEITLQVADGEDVSSRSFMLTVLAPPILAPLPDHLIYEDEVLTIPLEIFDGDTPLAALTLSADSSNLGLIPPSSIEFTGTDSNRFLVVTPWPNRHGNAEIAVTVSDGELSHTEVIALTVRPVNDPPFISVIADQVGAIDQPHAVGFLVSDVESPAASLQVSASSSDADLIPPRTLEVIGHGNSRTLQFSPAPGRTGSALVRIEVSDGEVTTTREFLVTVLPGQDGPYIPPIGEQVMLEDAIQVVSFEIQDPDTPPSAIRLWAGSSRPSLIHPDSIVLEGEGASRTATFVPLLNQAGSAILTVFASDGLTTNSRSFTVNILPVNDPPLLSFVPPQAVTAGASLVVSFSVIDPETPPSNLVVTARSSDPVLLPAEQITLLGTSYERSAVITTLSNQAGLVTIELTVSDGAEAMSRSFVLSIEGAAPLPGGEPQPGESGAGFGPWAG
ncbi:MAG TPA: fibronectin type III domain-containing protein, partial [Methylomirabilota bacterium]|nr:fibronectin type III domain-containing protein [Methylomirabilota bacterium]